MGSEYIGQSFWLLEPKFFAQRTCIFFDVFFSLSACSASLTPLWSLGGTADESVLARLTAGLEADLPLRPPFAFFRKEKELIDFESEF